MRTVNLNKIDDFFCTNLVFIFIKNSHYKVHILFNVREKKVKIRQAKQSCYKKIKKDLEEKI
jgi:hypothetical protein